MPDDPGRIERYTAQFAHFEEWVLLDRPDDFLNLDEIPAEHRMMMRTWPESFETYRHAMWAYLERYNHMHEWSSTIRSLLIRARLADPTGYEGFVAAFESAKPRYIEQRRNVIRRYQDAPDGDLRSQMLNSLSAFADSYEVDLPLWFLAVLGRAIKTGRFKPNLFGGPSATTTPQGSLIDSTIEALEGTPLATHFATTYDSDLRNAIQHNDYDLRVDEQQTEFRCLSTSKVWSGHELWQRITGTITLIEAIQTAMSYLHEVESPRLAAASADVGLVSCLYYGQEGRMPQAILFQLWCFYEMDAPGTWLDGSTVTFEQLPDGRESVNFAGRAKSTGMSVTEEIGDDLRKYGWMQVTRVPIAPDF